jgi:uncharacterized membrane protein
VATVSVATYSEPIHPLHAIFLAFPLPLFLGALLSDLAYKSSYQVQWLNFAQWLIAGALLIGAFALLWSLIATVRARASVRARSGVYFVVLLVMWVLGLINAFIHAKDAFATMPTGLYLSWIVTLLALVASWLGYSGFHRTEVQ